MDPEAAAKARARAAALAAAKGLGGSGGAADAFIGTTNAEFLRRRAQFEDVSSAEYEETPDGLWLKRVDINDHRNRYLVSKAETMQRVSKQTGAQVESRGKYYPDRLLANEAMPPLHLVVTASDRTAIDRAIHEIQQLLDQHISIGTGANDARPSSSAFWEEKIFPGMENSAAFPLRSKIIGPQGSYIRHIQQQSGARVQLKGQGSGFRELATGLESDEPLHVHISDRRKDAVERAKALVNDLLQSIRSDYEQYRAINPLPLNVAQAYDQPSPPRTPPPALPDSPPPALSSYYE